MSERHKRLSRLRWIILGILISIILSSGCDSSLLSSEEPGFQGTYVGIATGGGEIHLQFVREGSESRMIILDNLYGRRVFRYFKSSSQSRTDLGVSYNVVDVVSGETKKEYFKYNKSEDYILIRYPAVGMVTFWKEK